MRQPRISAIETPGGSAPNLSTLLRIAAAFDVGLLVWFAPFSELVERDEQFSPDEFDVPCFDEESEQPRFEATRGDQTLNVGGCPWLKPAPADRQTPGSALLPSHPNAA